MEPFSSPSRSRTSVPPKSEPGLAEWTSKIKAMQRQVDADEEAEQKRLEEEIAASRLARIRRSRGGHGTPPEFSRTMQEDESPVDDMKHITERQNSQTEALRKLSGVEEVASPRVSDTKPLRSSPASRTREPISLAAFMGGRAAGPRLNRHAPQQDAHDPTQFEQRTHIDASHPVFGRGGVAMPGISGRGGSRSLEPSRSNTDSGDAVERYKPSRSFTQSGPKDSPSGSPSIARHHLGELGSPRERERTTSTPNSPYTKKIHSSTAMHEERPVSPQKTGGRERTTSSPGTPYSRNIKSHVPSMAPHEEERSISPQKTGGRERTISTPNATYRNATSHITSDPVRFPIERSQIGVTEQDTNAHDASKSSPFSMAISHSFIPRQHTLSTPQKSTITTPSLARPIYPEPRPSPQAPQIPASQTASPAFLRLPFQKDPTPSISRLQGRGFVQNMVKASSQLESPTSTSTTPDKSRSAGGRKVSVLDRWQAHSSPGNTSMSPPPSPGFSAARKPRPADWTTSQREPTSILNSNTPKTPLRPLKSMSSLPSMSMARANTPVQPAAANMIPPEGSPGLGSATTLIVYKPTQPPNEFTHVDELGIQHSVETEATKSTAAIPAPSGKPLVHPTRDRARKPRKGKEALQLAERDEGPLPSPAPAGAPESWPSGMLVKGTASITDSVTSAAPQATVIADETSPAGLVDFRTLPPLSSRVKSDNAEPTIIMPKFVSFVQPPVPGEPKSGGMASLRILPGLTKDSKPQSQPNLSPHALPSRNEVIFPSSTSPTSSTKASSSDAPQNQREISVSPKITGKNARIPSTGNRATVMDVAQALNGCQEPLSQELPSMSSTSNRPPHVIVEASPQPTNIAANGRLRNPNQSEKRRSTYERYSALMLPPLKEEATPTSSPATSLSRAADPVQLVGENESLAAEAKLDDDATISPSILPGTVPVKMVHFDHVDEPLPTDISFISSMGGEDLAPFDPDTQTVSVDVMSIIGNSAVVVAQDIHIFHDTEILAIVNRSKSKSSGLASTVVWAWLGRRGNLGEKEEQKLQEIAKRYGTVAKKVRQHSEPIHLIKILGGELVIRQGARSHWSSENTAMHSVRSVGAAIIVDEHELSIQNMCSGYSYCVTILSTVYVWHGRGSTLPERQAAMRYAAQLVSNSTSVIELSQGENDNDEMFWMILGEDDFANADYWTWRKASPIVDPARWRLNPYQKVNPLVLIDSFLNEESPSRHVYILDCIWELFVLVGSESRGDRYSIRLAITIAMQMSAHVASDRPYRPTVHILVLPTKLPVDLCQHFRDLDELMLNGGHTPDHMNMLSSTDALIHLQRDTWEEVALKNQQMLPLGLAPSDLPA